MKLLYGAFVQPGQLVFDIGANIGERTAMFRELGARVVAVDPQPVCVERLRARFASDGSVTIVPKAAGRNAGVAEMQTSQAHEISSMSAGWLASVKISGRFRGHNWDRSEKVEVTTLDALIAEHGRPSFCKVDVEGFESEVLAGLSTAIPAISFECTPEYLTNTTSCIERLRAIGNYEFNNNLSGGMNFELADWVGADSILASLERIDPGSVADIYARLRTA